METTQFVGLSSLDTTTLEGRWNVLSLIGRIAQFGYVVAYTIDNGWVCFDPASGDTLESVQREATNDTWELNGYRLVQITATRHASELDFFLELGYEYRERVNGIGV